MAKDFEPLVPQLQQDEQFPTGNSLKLPFEPGMLNMGIPRAIPCTEAFQTNSGLPAFGFSGLPNFREGQMKEPHAGFCSLPHFRPDLTPGSTFLQKINLPNPEANTPDFGGAFAPKQFLVFDQTGNKTTMIFSPGIGSPIQRLGAWGPKHATVYDDQCYRWEGNLTDESDEDHGANEASEMCEDSEEIDALLDSDYEENYSEDEEETSTGHSPDTMTADEKQVWLPEEDMDEVASSAGPVKRQKLSYGSYEVPTITDIPSSYEPNSSRSFEYEDDAESSCAGETPVRCTEMGSVSSNKRAREDEIHETVSLLRTIIPARNGTDAVIVLDEAIDYLKTLKFQAQSLGAFCPLDASLP